MSTAKPYNHIKFLKKALVQTILFSLLLFGVNGKAQVGVGIILGSENIRYQKHHSMHAWFTGAELTAQARVVSGRLLIQQSIPATKEFEGQYRTGRVVGGFYDNAIGVYKITEKQTFIGAGIGFTFRGSTDMTRPYFSLDMGSFFSTTI